MSINLSGIIEEKLSVLLNAQLRYIMRCADMGDFGFGEDTAFTDIRGITRLVSKYTLHLQCAFRLVNPQKIVLTNLDIYKENSAAEWSEDFNWDILGANLYDEQAQKCSELFSENAVYVVKVNAGKYGDVQITLSNNYVLEIFVNRSSDDECWRFLEYGTEKEHFVITGQGIETQ